MCFPMRTFHFRPCRVCPQKLEILVQFGQTDDHERNTDTTCSMFYPGIVPKSIGGFQSIWQKHISHHIEVRILFMRTLFTWQLAHLERDNSYDRLLAAWWEGSRWNIPFHHLIWTLQMGNEEDCDQIHCSHESESLS